MDRLIDLQMETGEDVTSHLGNGGLPWVFGFLLGPTEADETIGQLEFLGIIESEFGFGGKLLSDGIGTDGDAPGVVLVGLKQQDIAGLGTDVDQEATTLLITVIKAEGIRQCADGSIYDGGFETGSLPCPDEFFNQVGLYCDQEDFEFSTGSGTENLVIPCRLGQRERDVLLSLVLNDLSDLGGINGRQLDELRKDLIARGG